MNWAKFSHRQPLLWVSPFEHFIITYCIYWLFGATSLHIRTVLRLFSSYVHRLQANKPTIRAVCLLWNCSYGYWVAVSYRYEIGCIFLQTFYRWFDQSRWPTRNGLVHERVWVVGKYKNWNTSCVLNVCNFKSNVCMQRY